jgi:hypothetical protein
VLAISGDSAEDSRKFAARYELPFPLLGDADLAVSRQLTGVTSDGNTLPGIVIVRGDRQIVERRLATAKDDRVSTAGLLEALDRTLGTHGPALADDQYAAIDRIQLRLDAGAGHAASGATGVAAVTALVPLGRFVVAGPRASFDLRDAPVALGGELALRLPLTHDIAAVELGAVAGYAPFAPRGALVGGTATLWFAWSPEWALDLSSEVVREAGALRITGTFGVARMFETPW